MQFLRFFLQCLVRKVVAQTGPSLPRVWFAAIILAGSTRGPRPSAFEIGFAVWGTPLFKPRPAPYFYFHCSCCSIGLQDSICFVFDLGHCIGFILEFLDYPDTVWLCIVLAATWPTTFIAYLDTVGLAISIFLVSAGEPITWDCLQLVWTFPFAWHFGILNLYISGFCR